jgi:hypothetical protein
MTAYTGGFVLKNALVKFASTDFSNQVTKARLVPEVNVQSMRTLVPDGQITDIDSPVWTLELSGVQDYETGGLADYLRDNSGSLVTVIVAPVNTSGKQQWTVSVRCLPVAVGGAQGEWALFDVELPVQGQPTLGTVT